VILAALFAVAVTAAPCESLQFDLPPAYDAGPSPTAAVAADFDSDGNLDLLAGGLNGLTFLRALRREFGPDIPAVIFCTTENDMAHIEMAITSGAQEYIMKPFDEEILVGKLGQAGLL